METVYLVGFYGVGKTMIGKAIASRKSLKYLDINNYIEEKENASIKDIYQSKGPDYIKSLEKYALKNSITQGMIVSTSAVLVSDEENRHLIKESGRVIYLKASADTIYDNIKNYYKDIPIFNNDYTVLSVENYINVYRPYYEELQNYAIDIDGKSIEELISEALAIYNYINKVKARIFI